MLNLIICEFSKLKRSRIWWLLGIAALLPVILTIMPYLTNGSDTYYKTLTWGRALGFNGLLMNLGLGIIFFPLLAGYLYAREYTERTADTYLSYPYRREALFFSKFIVLTLLMLGCLLFSFLLTLAAGFIPPHDALTPPVLVQQLKGYLASGFFHVLLLPAAVFLAVRGRSYIPPIVLGMAAAVTNLVLMQSEYVATFPWCGPLLVGFNLSGQGWMGDAVKGYLTAGLSGGLAFLLALPLAVGTFKGRFPRMHTLILAALVVIALPLAAHKLLPSTLEMRQDRVSHLPREEGWRSDLAYLGEVLPRGHADFNTLWDCMSFLRDLEALGNSAEEMSDNRILFKVAEILARGGDAHTRVVFPFERLLPLSLYWIGEDLRIVSTRPMDTPFLGGRILEMEGIPLEQLVSRLEKGLSRENRYHLLAYLPEYLVNADILEGAGLIEAGASQVTFSVEGLDGMGGTLVVPVVRGAEALETVRREFATLLPPRPEENYSWEVLDSARSGEGRTLVIDYRRCEPREDLTMERFHRQVAEVLDGGEVSRVVVDFRGNPGGSSALFQPVMGELDRWEAVDPGRRISVLVDRKTFSAAILNACAFRERTKARFIGEPTGGKPTHYGETEPLVLPHSGTEIFFSTKHFFSDVEKGDAFYPDIHEPLTLENLLTGRDAVMERALAP